MGWWSEIFKAKAKDWFYREMPVGQTPNDVEYFKVVPNQFYVEVFLKSMRIVNVREGINKFYAATHSYISLPQKFKTDPAKFHVFTGNGNIEEMDAKNIDRILVVNKRLLGPIPYWGGDLELQLGLFSIKSTDLAKPYLTLLQEISTKAGVSFISKALTFAEPLQKGIELLTGSDSPTVLEIGLSTTFTDNTEPLRTGYFVVVRCDKNSLDISNLTISPNDYKLQYKDGRPVEDYPYFVFQVTASKQRNNWFDISELSSAYQQLRDEVRKGDFNKATEALIVFKRTLLTCGDLLQKDALEISKQVDNETNVALGATQVSAKDYNLRNLNEYNIY